MKHVVQPTGTDDHLAIQAAVNSAKPGDEIDLVAGDWWLANRVLVTAHGVRLVGRPGAVLRRALGYRSHLFQITRPNARVRDVELVDLRIDNGGRENDLPHNPEDDSAGLFDCAAIQLYNADDVRVRGCRLENVLRRGIHVIQSSDVLIEENHISDCRGRRNRAAGEQASGPGGVGIDSWSAWLEDPSKGIRNYNVTIRHNTIRRAWRVGIFGGACDGLTITGNRCEDMIPPDAMAADIEAGGQIVSGAGNQHVIITENIITGGGKTLGIEIDHIRFLHPKDPITSHVVIKGNVIRNVGLSGVLLVTEGEAPLQRDVFTSIEGNIIDGVGLLNPGGYWGGVHVNPAIGHFSIVNNMIVTSRYPAVMIREQCHDYMVAGNQLHVSNAAPPPPAGTVDRRVINDLGNRNRLVGGNLLVANGGVTI